MTAAERTTRLFIDEIDDDVVRVMRGDEAFSLPVALLPAGAREGDWIELSVRVIAPPHSDTESRREGLARDDPGGDIKL